VLGTTSPSVTCYGPGGNSTAVTTVYNDGTPVILQGRLTNATGGPVVGNVRLMLEPNVSNTGDSGSGTQVASVLSDANGNFGIALDPANSTIQTAMVNGWVNFEVDAFSSNYDAVSEIQRQWTSGIWTDVLEGTPATTPAPLAIIMADNQPGVRSLASATSVDSQGAFTATQNVVTTQNKDTVIGEYHDANDEFGHFDYAQTTDTSYDVAISLDLAGQNWKLSGTGHFSKSSSFLNGGGAKFQANSGRQMLLPIKWALTKTTVYPCSIICVGQPFTYYKWKPVDVVAYPKVGGDISKLDHQCNTTYRSYMFDIGRNQYIKRYTGRSYKFSAGVSLSYNGVGLSLATQSGFDSLHGWRVDTGSKYAAYHYCGNDDDPAKASRIFWGVSNNGA